MIILRLKTWHRGPSRGIIDGMVREYSRANPGVHVLHEAGQRGLRFHDEIQQDFNEGTVSDLFYMAGGSISAPFIDNGDVVELTEEYPQHNWDGILEAPARSMIMRDGRIYGVPLSACQMAFVYRRDVFEKLDLRAPANYAEMEANNARLRAAGVYPLAVGFRDAGYPIMRFFDFLIELCSGPALHDQLNELQVSWSCPEIVRALALLGDWVRKRWLIPDCPDLSSGDALKALYHGRAAMTIETESFEMRALEAGQNPALYDVFAAPFEEPPFRSYLYPHQLMIWSGSLHRAEAIRFADWYIQSTQQTKYYAGLEGTATVGVRPPEPGRWALTERFRGIGRARPDYYFPSDEVFDNHTQMPGYFAALRTLMWGTSNPESAAHEFERALRAPTTRTR
jgi:raffinose/stachyose/melibiose transport system substrate-binding protein